MSIDKTAAFIATGILCLGFYYLGVYVGIKLENSDKIKEQCESVGNYVFTDQTIIKCEVVR